MSTTAWKKYRLDELALIQGGGTPKRAETSYFGGDIPWVTPTDLPSIGIARELSGTTETLTDAGLSKSSAKLIDAGSVLFSSRATIGKIAVTSMPCATNQGFINFTPYSDKIDLWFLSFMLCRYTPEIKMLAGKTTFLEVPRGKLKGFLVAVPPLDEQHRIVARIKECMERVEEIEGLREKQKNDNITLQDAILDALLNEDWPIRSISDLLADIRNGWSGKQNRSAPEYGILRLSCVHSKVIDLEDIKILKIGDEVAKRFYLKKGDVFVVRGNGSPALVGRSAIANEDSKRVIFNDLLIRLRFTTDVLPSFVNYLFHTRKVRKQIIAVAKTAAGIWKINQKGLSLLKIPCPALDVQTTFVNEAETALENCVQLTQGLEDSSINHLRESILRKAFAGDL